MSDGTHITRSEFDRITGRSREDRLVDLGARAERIRCAQIAARMGAHEVAAAIMGAPRTGRGILMSAPILARLNAEIATLTHATHGGAGRDHRDGSPFLRVDGYALAVSALDALRAARDEIERATPGGVRDARK